MGYNLHSPQASGSVQPVLSRVPPRAGSLLHSEPAGQQPIRRAFLGVLGRSVTMRKLDSQVRWRVCWVIGLALFLLLSGCGKARNQVVLRDESGSRKLVYDCSAFRPQAESGQDRLILALARRDTVRHAAEHQRFVTARSLQAAWENMDWRAMERLIVEYHCSHRRDRSNGGFMMRPELIVFLAVIFSCLGVYTTNPMFPVSNRPQVLRGKWGGTFFIGIMSSILIGGASLLIWSLYQRNVVRQHLTDCRFAGRVRVRISSSPNCANWLSVGSIVSAIALLLLSNWAWFGNN